MIIHDWITKMEQLFPPQLAEQWDNVGLQVGNAAQNMTGILLTLDVTKEVLEEAISENINFIIAHHPLLFRPLSSIDTSTYVGQMIEMIIKNDLTIYAAHTNLDIADQGLNTILADMLQLENHRPLSLTTESLGLGRIGQLKKPIELNEFIHKIKKKLKISTLRLIGDTEHPIKTVAICGGSGSSLIDAAIEAQADVYISGDITYHHALDAKNVGLTILDVGHNIEKEVLPHVKKMISSIDETITITVSKIDSDYCSF